MKYISILVILSMLLLIYAIQPGRLLKRWIIDKPEVPMQKLVVCYAHTKGEAWSQEVSEYEDGDVALYGLLLTPNNTNYIEWLLKNEQDGLWAYDTRYPVSAADTAMVANGLMESGLSSAIFKRTAERLLEFRRGDGFSLYKDNNCYIIGACAPEVETTAYVSIVLGKVDPDRYSNILSPSYKYLTQMQKEDGRFEAYYSPSDYFSTYLAVKALKNSTYQESVSKAVDWTLNSQNKDGSWEDDIIDTIFAVSTLMEVGYDGERIENGVYWLANKQAEDESWSNDTLWIFSNRANEVICKPKEIFTKALAAKMTGVHKLQAIN